MSITRDDAAHVARLAQIALSDDELDTMVGQLSSILEHVQALSELDLSEVEPTAHALDLSNVTRPDEPRASWPRDEVLSNAPEPQDGAFRVPPA